MSKELTKDTLSVPVIFQKMEQYSFEDTRFAKVKIWLMHTGINENGSCFDRESIEKAIPTLANTPILGYIEKNSKGEEDFSDHRRGFVTKDGERKFSYLGSAYGVIPETHNAHFEKRLCDDGVEREYLVVDGLVWTKLEDGTDILFRDGFKAQSMELDDEDFDGYFDENGIFHFTHFVFYGACMLGVDVEPAMVNSTVELAFAKNLKDEIRNKLEVFNEYTKGGCRVADEIKDVVVEEVKVEETEVEATETEAKETEVEEVETKEVETESTEVEATETPQEVETESTEFATESEKEDEEESEKEDEEVKEEVETEHAQTEESKEEEEKEESESKEEEEEEKKAERNYQAEFESLEVEHENLKTEYAKLEAIVTELKEFKDSTLKAERECEEKALFEKYDAELTGVTEYEALKAKTTEFATVTDLEKEIALLFARNIKTSFSRDGGSNRVYFENNNNAENSRYGYLTEKYKA